MEVHIGPARMRTRAQGGTMSSSLIRDCYVMFVRGPCRRMEVHIGLARMRTRAQSTIDVILELLRLKVKVERKRCVRCSACMVAEL